MQIIFLIIFFIFIFILAAFAEDIGFWFGKKEYELTKKVKKNYPEKKKTFDLSHWTLSKAIEFKLLVDKAIGDEEIYENAKNSLDIASKLFINRDPKLSFKLKNFIPLIDEASNTKDQLFDELVEAGNTDAILIMALIRIPERVRNIAEEENFKRDNPIFFLVSADMQLLLITSLLETSNFINKEWNSVFEIKYQMLPLVMIEGREKEYKRLLDYLLDKENLEKGNKNFWEHIYNPLLYILKYELIYRKNPSPKKLMAVVDYAIPYVITNLLGPTPEKAFELVKKIKNKM